MVFRWILPKEGGGQVRRYLRFRRAILDRALRSNDTYPCPPITLFDFARHDDAVDAAKVQERNRDAWRISDDRVIGGFSESLATLIHEAQEANEEASAGDPALTGEDTPPFLRWTGALDTTVGLRSNAQRSGFAALRSPEFPLDGANLQGLYNALEITCRSDGRLYTVNLKVSSSIPDDIYQGNIKSSLVELDSQGQLAGPFETLTMPFGAFRLTSMGREREVFRELDDKICIESIGLALMDGKNGDFRFDLARIRAVNLYEGKVFEREPNKES